LGEIAEIVGPYVIETLELNAGTSVDILCPTDTPTLIGDIVEGGSRWTETPVLIADIVEGGLRWTETPVLIADIVGGWLRWTETSVLTAVVVEILRPTDTPMLIGDITGGWLRPTDSGGAKARRTLLKLSTVTEASPNSDGAATLVARTNAAAPSTSGAV
jgi:hypothetical protein